MRKENDYDKWLNDGLSESETTTLHRMEEKKTSISFYQLKQSTTFIGATAPHGRG